MVDKKLSDFGAVSAGDVSYFPILDNSTKNGKLSASQCFARTNCFTEIPQDIKVELSSGTLTLKAGSKVYVPNGVGSFSETTISSDRVCTTSTSAGTRFVFADGNSFFSILLQYAYSGNMSTMNSTTPISYGRFYNTETNKMYVGSSGSWVETPSSLPLAVVTNDSSGNFTSIEQVFNGFGYIGSTTFAVPGIKGLIPNGRNSDGTLKNNSFTTANVLTTTESSGSNRNKSSIMINATNIYNTAVAAYNQQENINYLTNSGAKQLYCIAGKIDVTSGSITNVDTKPGFHSADYYDLEQTNKNLSTTNSNISTLDAQNVKVTGPQTIGGEKTWIDTQTMSITGNDVITNVIADDTVVVSTAPTTARTRRIRWTDKNNNRIAEIQVSKDTTGNQSVSLFASNGVSGTTQNASIGVRIDADGAVYGRAPTPSDATDNTTKIATTAWVAGHRCTTKATTTSSASVNAPAYVVENYKNGTNWYRVWSDGWIEQGGVWSGVAANASATRNLLKPFDTTDYTCVLQPNTSSYANNGIHYIVSKTKTTTTISGYGTSSADLIWHAMGY